MNFGWTTQNCLTVAMVKPESSGSVLHQYYFQYVNKHPNDFSLLLIIENSMNLATFISRKIHITELV